MTESCIQDGFGSLLDTYLSGGEGTLIGGFDRLSPDSP